MKRRRFSWVLVPLIGVIGPWLFLFLWIPPFGFLFFDLFNMVETAMNIVIPDLGIVFLEEGLPVCYTVLIGGVILNAANAIILSKRHKMKEMWHSLLFIRFVSAFTYPALIFGVLLSILLLMGPARNAHIFYLLAVSIPALNLSGAFYAVWLLQQLKSRRGSYSMEIYFYLISQFVIGLDILTALMMRKEIKALTSNLIAAESTADRIR